MSTHRPPYTSVRGRFFLQWGGRLRVCLQFNRQPHGEPVNVKPWILHLPCTLVLVFLQQTPSHHIDVFRVCFPVVRCCGLKVVGGAECAVIDRRACTVVCVVRFVVQQRKQR